MTARAALALAAAILGAVPLGTARAGPGDGGPGVPVELAALRKGSLPRTLTLYGQAETDPAARQTVTAPAAAVVGAVYVRPGQEVAQGAPLIVLTPSPATAALYAQARSALAVAADLARRSRALVAQHLATQQELAAAEKSEADARAGLAALTAEGAAGPRTLRAPFAAVVTAVSTGPGAIVTQGAALVELGRPDRVILRLGAVPQQAAAIRPGDPAAITTLGTGDSGRGTVSLRGAMIDPQSGLVPVIVAPARRGLLPGEMVEVRIVTGAIHGWVVPHAAILVTDDGRPYVVEATDGIARRVRVRILGHDRDRDVVAGPFDPAAALVLTGNYQLEDGMRVRVAGGARAVGR